MILCYIFFLNFLTIHSLFNIVFERCITVLPIVFFSFWIVAHRQFSGRLPVFPVHRYFGIEILRLNLVLLF